MLAENLYNHPQEYKGRRVTYQVAFRGKDGIVLASDRKELREKGPGDEGTGPTTHLIKKLSIDPSGRFAWAYAGGETSPVAAKFIGLQLKSMTDFTDKSIDQMLEASGTESWIAARGPNQSTILFIDGATKKIRRVKLYPDNKTVIDIIEDGRCVNGQTYNLASFWSQAGYSKRLGLNRLVPLSAYMLFIANKMSPECIEGADIAVFRYAVRKFEFLSSGAIRKAASEMDKDIRKLISGHS